MSRKLQFGSALHATSKLIVPRGRPNSSLYCVINGFFHLHGGSTISLDHSCTAPLRASSAVEGLRGRPSGGVYQLAEKPNGVLAAGFIILAHLDMSDRLTLSFLFARKSELASLRLYEAAFCAISRRGRDFVQTFQMTGTTPFMLGNRDLRITKKRIARVGDCGVFRAMAGR